MKSRREEREKDKTKTRRGAKAPLLFLCCPKVSKAHWQESENVDYSRVFEGDSILVMMVYVC